MKAFRLLNFAALILSIAACGEGEDTRVAGSSYFATADQAPAPTPTPGATPADTLDAVALAREKAVDKLAVTTYKEDILPKLTNYCLSCHSGATPKGNLDLSSLDKLKANAAKLQSAIRGKKMPPKVNEMSADQRKGIDRLAELVDQWKQKPSEEAEDLPSFKNLNYKDAIGPLTFEVCAKCHGGDAPKANIKLTNEAELEAKLDGAIKAIENGKMPPKLDSGRREQLVRILKAWDGKGKP